MKHYANFIALTGIPSFRIYEILDSGAFVAIRLKIFYWEAKLFCRKAGL